MVLKAVVMSGPERIEYENAYYHVLKHGGFRRSTVAPRLKQHKFVALFIKVYPSLPLLISPARLARVVPSYLVKKTGGPVLVRAVLQIALPVEG